MASGSNYPLTKLHTKTMSSHLGQPLLSNMSISHIHHIEVSSLQIYPVFEEEYYATL